MNFLCNLIIQVKLIIIIYYYKDNLCDKNKNNIYINTMLFNLIKIEMVRSDLFII